MVFHNVSLRIWIIQCFLEQPESHILHCQSARKASSISLIWGQYEKLHSCKMTCAFNLPVVSYRSCRHCPHSVCKPLSPLSLSPFSLHVKVKFHSGIFSLDNRTPARSFVCPRSTSLRFSSRETLTEHNAVTGTYILLHLYLTPN